MARLLKALFLVVLLCSCGPERFVKKGDKFYELGEYYDAAAQYKRAYSQTPSKERATRGKRALKMAESYRRIGYSQKAMAAYRNAVRYKAGDSLTLFYMGQQMMLSGNYKEALAAFTEAQDSGLYGALIDSAIVAAQNAPAWKAEGSKYTVKKQDFLNSRRSEYSPMLTGDDNDQLYFTSTRNDAKGDEYSGITGVKPADIFVTTKDEKGKWTKPEAVEGELNTEYDEGACAFTPDGKTMYLTQCSTDPSYPRYAQIVSSKRADASWGKATELKIINDTLSSLAHPAISPDGEWLYFTSDMPGGLGGYDLWRIRLTATGIGGVENLGAPINTAGNEVFPTFRPNGDLYFSSDGHPGLGGLDIFIAAADEEGEGYHIEHPGYPLNSQGDDFGMTFEGLLNKGYFCSNRGDGRGWDHIYSFDNPEVVQAVKGWVFDNEGYELTDALVYMVGNDGTNLKISVKGDGSFTQQIKPDVEYVLLAVCKNHLNHTEELYVEAAEESETYELHFPLADISAPVLVENIFFDFNKATLRPESESSLNDLVDMLNDNPNITIELGAHTDCRGVDAYNTRLSQLRAESVVNYLVEQGIDSLRLTPKGYGEERPKTVKAKVAAEHKFLKEGDILTEEFIMALKDEAQQEICHQLNRRTEFRVLRTTYGLFDENGNLKQPIIEHPESQEEEEIEPYEDLF